MLAVPRTRPVDLRPRPTPFRFVLKYTLSSLCLQARDELALCPGQRGRLVERGVRQRMTGDGALDLPPFPVLTALATASFRLPEPG